MWDKYVIKGEPWGDESLGEVFSAAFTGVTTVFSGKGVVDNAVNYQNTKHDILTSQCFVEGTLVLTIDGEKPIEEIQAGDLVYSTDTETGESEYKEVVQTFENEANELVHITVDDEEITSTPKHPFYVPQKGWTSAVDLKAGDILVLSNGEYITVEKVQHEILENPVKVYNFEVEDFHTYYVGDNSILVHNQCTTVDNERGSNPNGEAHNVVNYAKYKEVLKTTEEANPLVESLRTTGELPQEYVAKTDAMAKGWKPKKALNNYIPGGQIGGDKFLNNTGILPKSNGRIWYEADVGLCNTISRAKQPGTRLVYSNDGLMYVTYDHYVTVHPIGTWK